MSVTEVAPVEPEVDGSSLSHAYCDRCGLERRTALCGFVPPPDAALTRDRGLERCVVCVEMFWKPCPHCGLEAS